jgi:hypothetical protein
MDRSDCQKRVKACSKTLPPDHQTPIRLLEPGKRPLRLEAWDHLFDGSPTIFPHSHETKTPLSWSGRKKPPLTISGLKKMDPGEHLWPQAFAPHASVVASSVRDDVRYEYTCFMRWGEDARLHERFHRITWWNVSSAHRKSPEVRLCRLSIQFCVGNRPPSTSTPH